MADCPLISLIATWLLLCIASVFASDQGVTFIFPTEGLTLYYLDTLNVSWTSNFYEPILYTFCKNSTTGDAIRERSGTVPSYNASEVISLNYTDVSACWFDLRPNDTAGNGASSSTFNVLSSQRPAVETVLFNLTILSPNSASSTLSSTTSYNTSIPTATASSQVKSMAPIPLGSTSNGLTAGAKAGISVCVIITAAAISAILYMFLIRRRLRSQLSPSRSLTTSKPTPISTQQPYSHSKSKSASTFASMFSPISAPTRTPTPTPPLDLKPKPLKLPCLSPVSPISIISPLHQTQTMPVPTINAPAPQPSTPFSPKSLTSSKSTLFFKPGKKWPSISRPEMQYSHLQYEPRSPYSHTYTYNHNLVNETPMSHNPINHSNAGSKVITGIKKFPSLSSLSLSLSPTGSEGKISLARDNEKPFTLLYDIDIPVRSSSAAAVVGKTHASKPSVTLSISNPIPISTPPPQPHPASPPQQTQPPPRPPPRPYRTPSTSLFSPPPRDSSLSSTYPARRGQALQLAVPERARVCSTVQELSSEGRVYELSAEPPLHVRLHELEAREKGKGMRKSKKQESEKEGGREGGR